MIEYGVLCIEDQHEALAHVRRLIPGDGFRETAFETVPDENAVIRRTLRTWTSARGLALVLTIGGCGVGVRERVPEVSLELIERPMPGIAELARLAGIQKSRRAALWRNVAGQVGRCLLVNLPAQDTDVALEAVLPVLPLAIEGIRQGEQLGA